MHNQFMSMRRMLFAVVGLLLMVPALAGAAEPIAKPDPNGFLLCDFDPDTSDVRKYVGEGDVIDWEFVTSPVAHGSHSLKVNVDSLGWSSLWARAPEGGWDLSQYRAIRFWVYGDGSGMNVKVAARDANDKRFESSETYKVDFKGWKMIEVPLASFPADVVQPLRTVVFLQLSQSSMGTIHVDLLEAVK